MGSKPSNNTTLMDVLLPPGSPVKEPVYYRIVTGQQYQRGWLRFLQEPLPMTLICKLEDGNYVVEEPEA